MRMCEQAGADTVVVDSLKDAAIGLSDDEVGAGWNRARQFALREGVQVLELHHTVKRGANGAEPNTLADIYGSTWITSGAGSVISLWGEAGDPIVSLRHLKQPFAEVGPFRLLHDHTTGITTVHHTAISWRWPVRAGAGSPPWTRRRRSSRRRSRARRRRRRRGAVWPSSWRPGSWRRRPVRRARARSTGRPPAPCSDRPHEAVQGCTNRYTRRFRRAGARGARRVHGPGKAAGHSYTLRCTRYTRPRCTFPPP